MTTLPALRRAHASLLTAIDNGTRIPDYGERYNEEAHELARMTVALAVINLTNAQALYLHEQEERNEQTCQRHVPS